MHASLWQKTCRQDSPRAPQGDVSADVCVVGAGLAGLLTAYRLQRAGVSVVVVDSAAALGGGETARTTAHLSDVFDDRFEHLESLRGRDVLRAVRESHKASLDLYERVCGEEDIECGFRRLDGYLFVDPSQSVSILDREQKAAANAGAPCEFLPRVPWGASFDSGPCLRFPNQAEIHPLKFVEGLGRAIRRRGGLIRLGTRVKEVMGGAVPGVRFDDGHGVISKAVVVATNTPISDRVAAHTKLYPYTTYALALEMPAGLVPLGLFWDTLDAYHYVRTTMEAGREFLVVGGEDHKTGQADDGEERWRRLEAWARERWPQLRGVAARWSGMVMETPDGAAYIGPDANGMENVFVVTGDSGMGLTHAGVAALMLPDLIAGRGHDWAAAYDPKRKPVFAPGTFLAENANVAAVYADWITPAPATEKDISPGCGGVVRSGLSKLAVFKDDNGGVHRCSAVCPHLGAVVRYNSAEGTFDCPAHGSRFTARGKVIHGPSPVDLPEAE